MNCRWCSCFLIAACVAVPAWAQASDVVTFRMDAEGTQVLIGDWEFARYNALGDALVQRPFLFDVRAPGGIQVTRAHPPREGIDATDHASMHPGIWLAFGDIDGVDFWRNKGRVAYEGFVGTTVNGPGFGAISYQYGYFDGDRRICTEFRRMKVHSRGGRVFLLIESEFVGDADFHFGDQDEMGLCVRVATPMTVENGGRIVNSDGGIDEAGCWGKQADWAEYSGEVDGRRVAVMLMPDPDNFRRSWFHARDYGLLVANPFGRKAFTDGEPSRVEVKSGEEFRLAFGVCVYTGEAAGGEVYAEYLALRKDRE